MSALEDAIAILGCFSVDEPALSQAELARRAGVPKASASRIMKVLRDKGILDHDAERRSYSIGVKLFELGQIYRLNHDFLSLLNARLDRICQETGMTGYVTVFDGADLVVLRMVQGRSPLAIFTPPGVRAPCWRSSNGRAMLALLSDAEVRARLPDPLPEMGPKSPASIEILLEMLARIRADGRSSNASDALPGVASEGVALRDPDSGEIFGIAISFPDATTPQAERDAIAAQLAQMVRDLNLPQLSPPPGER